MSLEKGKHAQNILHEKKFIKNIIKEKKYLLPNNH